ncbi:hypothetical protein [Phaeobacter sp.]|uniref:hypothetical protein n=1 Tax=Phaeobacter sp. TaxID=1902409 RepID=UPI0025D2EA2B|nr:hypothetical protein [Phaeobacter sp.]
MQEHNSKFSYYISGAALIVALAAFAFACWSVQTESLNDEQRNEIAIVLTTIEIVIVVAAIFGFWTIRESVARQTRDVAKIEAGEMVTKFLEQNGSHLIKEAFEDTELVSRLEAAFQDTMIDSSANADYVDDDPDWEPS